jgi:magnesium transporter
MTKQLLSLLTPDERAIAATLLGYPEGGIGHLMAPDYITVRQDCSIQHVVDHVRERRLGFDPAAPSRNAG